MGIGRYISGLLPQLGQLLGERLLVLGLPSDAALIRALVGRQPLLKPVTAQPYRFAEQSALLLELASLRLPLIHFPHYNIPIAYPFRFVVTIHDLFSYEFHSGPIPRRINRILISTAVKRSDAIIAPSRATEASIRSRFPRAAARISVIPEAADDRFAQAGASGSTWQQYYGIRTPYFLYLGQWKAYKNLPVLIEAFRLVLAEQPGCQLVIAGRDERHPEIPAAAERLPAGSIVLPGRLPDDAVPTLYRGAAAIVLPSLAEGFGLPVMEAMASGTQVVCSDIPALREIADGIAIFCDPADPASFARGMLEALTVDSVRKRRQSGLARAGEFSWHRAAEKTAAVYERALKG